MTTERAALLRAVLADPADDTARLVLADWMQENGEEDRAAFVRWQIAAGNQTWSEWPTDGNKWPFADWPDSATTTFFSELRVLSGRKSIGYRWRRGFIDHLTLPARLLLQRAAELFSVWPLEYVRLGDVNPEPHPRVDLDPGEPPDGVPHILVGVDLEHDNSLFGSRVPMPIWDLIGHYTALDDTDPDQWPHKEFASKLHALEALSCACVKWGRAEAGLPPWEPPFRLS